MFDTSSIVNIIITAFVLIISIGVHEYAHAFVSNKLWDPTPKNLGRLTPNPLAHIDPIGLIMVFVVHFGRWKPVPINPSYYKDPKVWEFLVSIAWPLTNLILSLICFIILKIYLWSDFTQFQIVSNIDVVVKILSSMWLLNIWLAVFNMLPIPPLDGWKFVKLFNYNFFTKLEYTLYSNPLYMMIPFLLVMYSGIGARLWYIVNGIVNFYIKLLS